MEPNETKGTRPGPNEYPKEFEPYISLVTGNDVVPVLETQRLQMMQLFAARGERDGKFRYGADKWSVKQVLGHVIDSERIFSYRALCIARGDETPLPGFEQDDYMQESNFDERTLRDLVDEFTEVRSATISFFRHLSTEAWERKGVADKKEISVRALAFLIAGHELHHRGILEERYFSAIPRA